jgi:hypothetical protein
VRLPRLIARRPRLAAAAALTAVALALVAFQPLGSPWWSGYDYDSVYVGSGLTLFRGEQSRFYDHPGAPLQEALAATFTAAWAAGSPGESRAARADRWAANLDSTRPYLRVWGTLLYVASALIVLLTVAWTTRSALFGLLAGLLFLGAPDVIAWAAVVKPDPLLAALAVACVGALVEGWRRRSGPLYLAAGFLFGLDMTVKVQAIGLAVPMALALLLRPPRPGWTHDFRAAASAWLRAHRRIVGIGSGIWLALVLVLNALAAPPAAKPLAELVAGVAALALVSAVAWLALRRTRAAGLAGAAIGVAAAAVAGAVVPNLFYASVPAPTLRQMALTVGGGGVNAGAHPAVSPVTTLHTWGLLLLAAALGLVLALRDRRVESVLWVAGAAATGFLAYLRFGEIHYYTTAVALAVPLVFEYFRVLRWRRVLAPIVVAVIAFSPFRLGIDLARGRAREADATVKVNRWVAARLPPGSVALTRLEAGDARFFHLVQYYVPSAPAPRYRFLPPDPQAARYVREHGLRVRYVVTGSAEDVTALLRSIGLDGRAARVRAPGFVYRVRTDQG